ncbi:hypothetical protein F5146DRAFT_1135155 [Armillaria mellea]|nr:hypothetical protein F5146DRAFT_1135155 [Armillaria mellea]
MSEKYALLDEPISTDAPPSYDVSTSRTVSRDGTPSSSAVQGANTWSGNDLSHYEEKYPEDNLYEETASNARVWRTYVDESTNYDARMVVAPIERAIANGSSVGNVPVSSLNPYAAFTLTTTDVWVNGLWFMSLSLSLATALVAVLVKWLHHYPAFPSGTHVLVIIGLPPVLMHLALGILFVGLFIFLVPLRLGLSWIIGPSSYQFYTPNTPTAHHWQISHTFPIAILQDLLPKHIRPFFVEMVDESVYYEPDADGIISLDDLEREMYGDTVYRRPAALSEGYIEESIWGSDRDDLLWDAMQIRLHSVKPKPGMEPKVERLLCFEVFIPV